ncbi:MAG: hypothetical protein Q8920_16245 [Bacillota bacterium]|nr:hypothetical protein [Bacillota bacterium]
MSIGTGGLPQNNNMIMVEASKRVLGGRIDKKEGSSQYFKKRKKYVKKHEDNEKSGIDKSSIDIKC